jgi:hypothetical protein
MFESMNQQNFMKFYEILWNFMKFYEILWNFMKSKFNQKN